MNLDEQARDIISVALLYIVAVSVGAISLTVVVWALCKIPPIRYILRALLGLVVGPLETWIRSVVARELADIRSQLEPNGGASLVDKVDAIGTRQQTIISEISSMGHNVTVVEQAIDAQRVALNEHVKGAHSAETLGHQRPD